MEWGEYVDEQCADTAEAAYWQGAREAGADAERQTLAMAVEDWYDGTGGVAESPLPTNLKAIVYRIK